MDKSVLSRATAFIDAWMQYRYERLDVPGFVVTIAHDGDVVLNKACGFANLENAEAMTTDHLFRIASHSKTFAATSIMQLAERKLLNIDEPVATYLTWLSEHRDPRMQKITARQLMSHSAGMIRDGADCSFWEVLAHFPDDTEFKQSLLNCDLVYDNNQQMKYSNFGYTLLGKLIEAISQMSFHEYVTKNILEPLNMQNSGPEYCPEIEQRLVTGYTRRDRQKQRTPISRKIDTKAMAAATGFYSTAADMCKYFAAQCIGSGLLLNDESKKEMQRTQWRLKNSTEDEEYGLGYEIDYVKERRFFGHGGGFPGQRTRTFCDPNDKLIVIVLTNSIDGEAQTMGRAVISAIDHFVASATNRKAADLSKLRSFEGTLHSLWADYSIVEHGDKLAAINPDSWFPFSAQQQMQHLEVVDDSTLRIVKAGGYYSQGELVKFYRDKQGTIERIVYSGTPLWARNAFDQRIAESKAQAGELRVPATKAGVPG
jgi:CubicO group peptidase (beta-lactamase class C family)